MDTIFTDSKNSKTSKPHRLFNLSDEMNLIKSYKYVVLSNLYHTYILYMDKYKKVIQKQQI